MLSPKQTLLISPVLRQNGLSPVAILLDYSVAVSSLIGFYFIEMLLFHPWKQGELGRGDETV